jgi:serine/threonine protein kinase
MTLASGTKLGPYEILAIIGAGGMGQVYRAKDTRLCRTVAIKVLNKEHMQRFEHEARAIAALNHPHICTLHDIGPDYPVMEYVDGAAIKGPLPVEQAVRLAIQIAGALKAKGIITLRGAMSLEMFQKELDQALFDLNKQPYID